MGYEVIGLGELDVRTIKESGKSPFEQVNIPQICANVVYADTKKPLLKKGYLIKKMPSGIRVAVIGIMGTMTLNAKLSTDLGVEVLPPDETLRKTLKDLKGKADLFVVLAHTGYQDAKKLAETVTGVDIILSSHPSPVQTDFERIGTTILMHCKGTCKYVGRLVLEIDAEGRIASANGTQDPLDVKYDKDPKMQKLIDDTETAVSNYYNKGPSHVVQVTGLNPNDQSEPQPYVGAQRCVGCHLSIHQSWQKTAHAEAFDSLAKQDANGKMNPDCLSCHTTGYGVKGGFRTEAETAHLKNVQCESCHGPGVAHLRKPSEKGYGATDEKLCRKCHDGANSPKFNYSEYRAKIAHKSPAPAK